MSYGYLVLYFVETGEFSTMPARNNNAYVGKKYYITYEDREEPYAGVVKGVCETEKQADALIDKFTNVDETTLKILRQKIPSLQIQTHETKSNHLSAKNIKYCDENEPKRNSSTKPPKKWYKNGELVIENEPHTTEIERIFEESDLISAKKTEKKRKLMKKKK